MTNDFLVKAAAVEVEPTTRTIVKQRMSVMRFQRVSRMCIIASLTALGTNFGLHKVIAAQPRPADAEEGVEVLTRGPVHEAFAETVTFNPEPGIVVPKAPPAAIEELPPEQRPEGANVAWIPGYWGWDDERNDFLWVSGIWRALPPGRQWVSGYWAQSGRDIQWTSGYWADAAASEVDYLPEPPATVEVGPNIAAPSADQSWIPGCWVWHQGRYAWRPGYWATVQPNWVWVPAHYVWAPRGYVFVDGYWDYSVARRGVLYAPVYFQAGLYTRPGFQYSPAMVINPAVFAGQLFVRPHYQHYYFGDYYAASYANAGYYSWFSFHNRQGYDPIYAQQHWQHRQDRAWERNVQADFQRRRDHAEARPPRTLASQRARAASKANSQDFVVAAPLDRLSNSKDSPMRFQQVDKQDRQKYSQHTQAIQRFREQRQQLETSPADSSAKKSLTKAGPTKVTLPRSFIVAKSAAELGKDQGPPKRHEVLKPNLEIKPKPRVSVGRRGPPTGAPSVNKAETKPAPPQAEPNVNQDGPQGESKDTPKK